MATTATTTTPNSNSKLMTMIKCQLSMVYYHYPSLTKAQCGVRECKMMETGERMSHHAGHGGTIPNVIWHLK